MSDISGPIRKVLEEAQDIILRQIESDRVFYTSRIESPIEEVMAMALGVAFKDSGFYPPANIFVGGRDIYLELQAKLGKHRVDFLLRVGHYEGPFEFLVIECDGHEFHERTKMQAAKDKGRDRWLQNKGYDVFRFTGSEIWNDPMGCARQVVEWAIEANFRLTSKRSA